MGHAVLSGNPPVEIILRRSARARRVSLRVSALDGRVTLSMPQGMDETVALAFAEEKSAWIRRHLARQSAPVIVAMGARILYCGQQVPIAEGIGRRATFDGSAIRVPAPPQMVAPRVKAFLKLDARQRLADAVAKYAARVDRAPGKIVLRDTRSRWGSCTSQGDLNFSWRLAMAPPEALDYVAAHEVAHLVEMNHSANYWAVVRRICPGFDAPRRWLRSQGGTLHRYRFDD